jgi:tRNA (adenine22-N1)-methyltransferase
MISLSKRMKAVAHMVSPVGRVVDIGTDHAYIPIYLVGKGIKEKALACDVNKGPLTIARGHISENGLEEKIGLCLSDGLKEVDIISGDSIVIAGMGGLLIKDIISSSMEKAGLAGEMILQPQSEYGQLRTFLRDSGFVIEDEDALEEEGKFYFLMKTVYKPQAAGSLNEAEAEFGPILLKRRDETLKAYLEKQEAVNIEIISELNKQEEKMSILRRAEEVRRKISLIKKALRDYYEMQ